MRRIVSIFLAFILVIVAMPLSLVGCSESEEFVPVLRFAVASDVHIDDNGSEVEEARLARLFEVAYRHSSESELGYDKLDAVIFVGDYTQSGTLSSMQKFKSIVDSNIKPETKLAVSLGNHEFYTDTDMTESRHESVFGDSVDDHFVISGFHFIKASPYKDTFNSDKLAWLEQQLWEASNDAPSLPIFVMQHHNAFGTIYGSGGWGAAGLYGVLQKYPQAVDFSGHSHFPIQDERSLWQGDFTAIGTGTVSYVEMGLNGVSDDYVFPVGRDGGYQMDHRSGASDYGVFQIMECDRIGNMLLTGYDITSGARLFERRIDAPTSKKTFVTNSVKEMTTDRPEFKKGAKCEYTSMEDGSVTITVPQAVSDDYIESYRAKIFCGGKYVGTFYALSGHIFVPIPETVNIRVTGLTQGKKYTVKVYGVNAYGRESLFPIIFKMVP